jgi:hypothetical protein
VVGSLPQLGNWDPSNAVRAPIAREMTMVTDKDLRGIDPAGPDQLPRVGRNGVLATEHRVRVQVYP